jgi:putative multiple sugar transport system substrate-binding protein
MAGEQTSTVFKDTRTLAAQVAKMVDQFLAGETVEINNTDTYDNGVKVVPSYLLPVVSVTKDTVVQELVDTGYYTQAEIDG